MSDKPIRMGRGMTLDDVEAALSKPQKLALAVALSRRDEEDAKIEAVREQTRKAVKQAISAGVPPILIAERLNITRSRVYQMRDEAASETISG